MRTIQKHSEVIMRRIDDGDSGDEDETPQPPRPTNKTPRKKPKKDDDNPPFHGRFGFPK